MSDYKRITMREFAGVTSVELRTPIYIALKNDTLEEASAMLKELEQNAAERNDNADAIIYGLRTVIGALKADKNHDER